MPQSMLAVRLPNPRVLINMRVLMPRRCLANNGYHAAWDKTRKITGYMGGSGVNGGEHGGRFGNMELVDI